MKTYIFIIFILITKVVLANSVDQKSGKLEQFIDQRIIDYYQQTQEVSRQQQLIDAKIKLLKKIDECKKLGFDCSDNTKLDFSKLQALPKPKPPKKPIKPTNHPPPSVISIINNLAILQDHTDREYQVRVGDHVLNYQIISINYSQVKMKNVLNQKITEQHIAW